MPAARRGRTGAAMAAAALVLLALIPAAASAGAHRYAPPGNAIFTGVSDTGRKQDYFDFAEAAGQHVPVMQSFETWGALVGGRAPALEADRDPRNAQHLDRPLLRVRAR